MATYVVTRVRTNWTRPGWHRHIEGVCIDGDVYLSRRRVIASLNRGDTWYAHINGTDIPIVVAAFCPHPGCLTSPYLALRRGNKSNMRLEDLRPC